MTILGTPNLTRTTVWQGENWERECSIFTCKIFYHTGFFDPCTEGPEECMYTSLLGNTAPLGANKQASYMRQHNLYFEHCLLYLDRNVSF